MSAHFILVRSTFTTYDYAKSFIDEIVCHHGIPLSIILDRGAPFTSRFLRSFQEGLGSMVKLSTIFHPQMGGSRRMHYSNL